MLYGDPEISKCLVFPKSNQVSAKEILSSLRRVIAHKRIGDLTLSGDRLLFRNLYLKRLDLLPIPKGWIQVREKGDGLQVTFSADYRWASNRRGRLLAVIAGLVFALVTFYKSMEVQQVVGAMPSPWFFLAIPVYVAILWLFVFGLNSWYSRLYLDRLIRSLMKLTPQHYQFGS